MARDKGIIVDVCFFNGVGDWWMVDLKKSPLYSSNNIQGEGTTDGYAFCTLKSPGLVARQTAYVRKIAVELNGFDNVLYDICDEPDAGSNPPLAPAEFTPWIDRMLQTFVDAESQLPRDLAFQIGWSILCLHICKILLYSITYDRIRSLALERGSQDIYQGRKPEKGGQY
jgi:hypothetical protein